MPTIPPSLPPSSGNNFNPLQKPDSYYPNQLKELWDNWFKNPSIESATALLDFINANKAKIEEIAGKNPAMMAINAGIIPIDKALKTAMAYLNTWIKEETNHPPANVIGPSEMIADVYNWISYAR